MSSPTRDFWHKRLGFRWAREYPSNHANYGRGNWRDLAQIAEGSVPYASTNAATSVGQSISANVTTLVQRWMGNGLNRGFHLNPRSSEWPIDFYGRGDPSPSNRPSLSIVTSSGTFNLTTAANATWNKTSFRGNGSKNAFRLVALSQPAVLRFDLSGVTGTVTSATLSMNVAAFDTGHNGHIVDIFECDPPTIIVPEDVPSPVLGLANEYASFNAMKNSGNPALVAADDFERGGPFDGGFTPAATRTLNPATGTTYARGEITAGSLGSATSRLEASRSTGPRGTPDIVREELFGQYWLYLENDFGTTADTAIKIPPWVSSSGSGIRSATGSRPPATEATQALASRSTTAAAATLNTKVTACGS